MLFNSTAKNKTLILSLDLQMGQSIQKWIKLNLWKTAFKKFEGIWCASSRSYSFKMFKGCLPQILLGPFLNTLSQV